MKVGWLADAQDPPGGAELTQAEFRAASPVEVVDCPPGGVVSDLDAYVIHNHLTYSPADLERANGRLIRYHHDVRAQFVQDAEHIFCSPLQRDHLGLEGACIPPPVSLTRFHANRSERRAKREGTICVGAYMNPGKGGHLVEEWAKDNGPVDFAGFGPFAPVQNVRQIGYVGQEELPDLLRRYERFVFLPTALEPFGRAVVEAWAAGCQVVTNALVGARYWLSRPEKIESAGADFWSLVCA